MQKIFKRTYSINSARRVVVTGLGLVTCLGVGVQHAWKSLKNAECGITSLKSDNTHDFSLQESLPCKVAGYVSKNELNIKNVLTKPDERSMTLSTHYSIVAADEALKDANLTEISKVEKLRSGICLGIGLTDMELIGQAYQNLYTKGYKSMNPHFFTKALANMSAGQLSIRYGFKGPNHCVSTACTTGVHSIGDAYNFIRNGSADIMLAGSTEGQITPFTLAGFGKMRALSTKFNSVPQESSRPFDIDRDGFVMSEGCGIVILEELNRALNRSANIYAEILGYGLSSDAYHVTAPSSDGSGAFNCMQAALNDAKIGPEQIGYVNAHATSTPLGDLAEGLAILKLFGSKVFVSSCKGAIGHLLGAAGSVESVFTILACHDEFLPVSLNCQQVDEKLSKLNIIKNLQQNWVSKYRRIAITNSFGFGGTNASLCIGEYLRNRDNH